MSNKKDYTVFAGLTVWCGCEHPCDGIAWTDDPLARAQGAWDNWDEPEVKQEGDWRSVFDD